MGESKEPAYPVLGTGWLPDTFDTKDHEYQRPEGVKDLGPVNLREKYPQYWDPVYDQYTLGSCVANAVAAAWTFEVRKFKAVTPGTENFVDDPSRLFIYWNARAAGNPEQTREKLRTTTVTIEDEGSQARMAMKSLHKLGVIDEKLMPYRPSPEEYQPAWTRYNVEITKEGSRSDEEVARLKKEQDDEWLAFKKKWSGPKAPVNEQPEKGFYPWALSNRILGYERLDVKRNDKERRDLATSDTGGIREADGRIVADNLRLALSDGHPVVFGFKYYEEKPFVTDFGPERYTLVRLKERHAPPPPDIKKLHCVLAIGYTDDYVLCQNSWGATWGPTGGVKDGLFHMPWSYITDFVATNDFWIIKTIRPLRATDKEDEDDARAEAETAAQRAKDEAEKEANKALETERPAAAGQS